MKNSEIQSDLNVAPLPEQLDAVTHRVLQAIRSVAFGSVEIVIHDSRIVQIERKEKLRFDGF